jgi:hypothetical protein
MTWFDEHTDTVIWALPAGSWNSGVWVAPVPVAFTVVPSIVTVGTPPTVAEPLADWPLPAGAEEA